MHKVSLNAIGDKAYHKPLCIALSIMISDDARDIVGSKMILNLNEPSKLKILHGLNQ
jgi:hypothetical protein